MPARPHILILMTDQQRADCMGCAGHPVLQTPTMDRLATEGVRFANAITTSPLCMPARASFVSGPYCHNHGIRADRGQLPADDETFFHHLQRAGYTTAYIGKSHFYAHVPGSHLRDNEHYMHARGIDYVHETTGPRATVKTRSYMTDHWERLGLYQAFQADYEHRRGKHWLARPSPLPEEEFLDSYIGRQAVEYIDGCDPAGPLRDAAFSEVAFGKGGPASRTTMVRTDRYKYAVNAAGKLREQMDRLICQWLLAAQVCM